MKFGVDLKAERGLDAEALGVRIFAWFATLLVLVYIVPVIRFFLLEEPIGGGISLPLSLLAYCLLAGLVVWFAYAIQFKVDDARFFILEAFPPLNNVLSTKNVVRTIAFFSVVAFVFSPILNVLAGIPDSSLYFTFGKWAHMFIVLAFAPIELAARGDQISHHLASRSR